MTIKKTTLKFVFKLKTAPVIDSSWPKTILISVTECLERFCQFFKRRFCEESFYNNLYNYHRLAWLFSILLHCDVRFHFLFTTKYFFSTLHVPFQSVMLVNWYIFRRFYKAWSFVYLTLFAFFSSCYSLSADEDRTIRKQAYWQARREGGCDGCARTPPQTAEVHFFVKKINSKKKIIVLFCFFCSNSLIA